MDALVKTPLGRRARKALETRRRVLDAAEALFTRDGYAATTMTAIADQADVAVQTLYAVFGNKRALLTELIDARVVGDDHAGPLPDREDWQAMEREVDEDIANGRVSGPFNTAEEMLKYLHEHEA